MKQNALYTVNIVAKLMTKLMAKLMTRDVLNKWKFRTEVADRDKSMPVVIGATNTFTMETETLMRSSGSGDTAGTIKNN